MITVSIFRSAVDDTRETQRIEEPVTIKELFPEVDFDNSIISVNGFLQDGNYLLKDGDVCAIRLFPEGNGADWLAGAGIGLMAALTVINFWNPIGWFGAAIMAGGAVAGALGFGIASAAGWSVTSWLAPDAPSMKTPGSLDGIPQLQGAKNQSNYGKPVPLVLGRHLFTPMYVGNPYSTIGGTDGEDQYFQALYMLGYGKLKVTDIKLGVIGDLASNDGGKIENGYLPFNGASFLSKSNPQIELIQTERESTLYPQAVREESLNIELSNTKELGALNIVRFSAKNPMKIQIEITLPNGLIKYNEKGEEQDASVSISAEWCVSRPNDNGDDRWKPFARFGAGQNKIEYTNSTTEITRTKTKVMRFVAERTFYNYSEVSDIYDTRVIELKIQRTDVQSGSHQIIDKVYLTAIRTWLFDNERSKKKGSLVAQVPVVKELRNKTARLGFRIKATQNTQGMLDALNCIVESKCRTWNKANQTWSGSDWDIKKQQWTGNSETPSNNPAAVALKLLQSPTLGMKAYPDEDEMLDLKSFGEFYEWCEKRKYTCNGILTAEKRLDDVLALILSTGRATRILNGSQYGLLIDKKREYPVMILNSQNVLEASNQKGFADLPDGFLVRFVNEGDGYQQTEEYVMADGQPPKPESVIENLELPYITNRDQAVKQTWYQLACRHLRPEIWNRKLSVEGYLIGIGDLVEVQDDTIVVGIGEGARITGIQTVNGLIAEIQTDGQFDVSNITNKQFGVKIAHFDGVHDGVIRTIQVPVTAPGTYSNFTFNPPVELPFTPQPDDLVAFGEYSKITTPAICFGKKANGDGTFDLTLIPYQEGIYTTDSGEIPPYEANITTPQRPVQPTVVPEYVKTINDRISEVASRGIVIDVNSNFCQLILSIQSRILDIDKKGSVLEGYLPFTTQAVLYRGMREIPVRSEIDRYPGTGGDLFDPMLGDFVPASRNPVTYDIVFSLVGAPEGVTIDEWGLITVGKNAALGKENYIIVQAKYMGQIFRTKLYIKCGVYTPQYLGACYEATGTQTVKVKIGDNETSVIANQGDWVAYLGETPDGSIWEKGAVMRFNGLQWEKVDPAARSDSSLYIAAFDDLLEGAPNATFLSLIVGTIFTRRIVMTHDGEIESDKFEGANGTVPGFRFTAKNGLLEAIGAKFRDLTVNKGTFDSIDVTGKSTFEGELKGAQGSFSGKLVVGGAFSDGGSLIDDRKNGFYAGSSAIKASKLTLYGTLIRSPGSYTLLYLANYIWKKTTLGGLSQIIEALNLTSMSDNRIAVTGSIHRPATGQGDDYSWTINVMYLEEEKKYNFYGVSTDGSVLYKLCIPYEWNLNKEVPELLDSDSNKITSAGNISNSTGVIVCLTFL